MYCNTVRPFISATEQHQAAIDAGKPERAIYVEGRGAETFEACVASFRGQGGTLGLCGGFRVLGSSRKAIMARATALKTAGIRPYDLDTGESDGMVLLSAAIAAINGLRGMGTDPRAPRKRGAKGGRAKGVAFKQKRDAIMAEAIVIRIWRHPKLNGADAAAILGEPWSESSLRRLYGPR